MARYFKGISFCGWYYTEYSEKKSKGIFKVEFKKSVKPDGFWFIYLQIMPIPKKKKKIS